MHSDVSTILLGRRLIYVGPRGVVISCLTRLPFKNSIGPIRSHNSYAVQRSLIDKMQSSNMIFIARRSSRLTIASGIRNTDQSSFKCSAVQVLYQDIESFNTNKPVLFHAKIELSGLNVKLQYKQTETKFQTRKLN